MASMTKVPEESPIIGDTQGLEGKGLRESEQEMREFSMLLNRERPPWEELEPAFSTLAGPKRWLPQIENPAEAESTWKKISTACSEHSKSKSFRIAYKAGAIELAIETGHTTEQTIETIENRTGIALAPTLEKIASLYKDQGIIDEQHPFIVIVTDVTDGKIVHELETLPFTRLYPAQIYGLTDKLQVNIGTFLTNRLTPGAHTRSDTFQDKLNSLQNRLYTPKQYRIHLEETKSLRVPRIALTEIQDWGKVIRELTELLLHVPDKIKRKKFELAKEDPNNLKQIFSNIGNFLTKDRIQYIFNFGVAESHPHPISPELFPVLFFLSRAKTAPAYSKALFELLFGKDFFESKGQRDLTDEIGASESHQVLNTHHILRVRMQELCASSETREPGGPDITVQAKPQFDRQAAAVVSRAHCIINVQNTFPSIEEMRNLFDRFASRSIFLTNASEGGYNHRSITRLDTVLHPQRCDTKLMLKSNYVRAAVLTPKPLGSQASPIPRDLFETVRIEQLDRVVSDIRKQLLPSLIIHFLDKYGSLRGTRGRNTFKDAIKLGGPLHVYFQDIVDAAFQLHAEKGVHPTILMEGAAILLEKYICDETTIDLAKTYREIREEVRTVCKDLAEILRTPGIDSPDPLD